MNLSIKQQSSVCATSFYGMAERLPRKRISNASDAIEQWVELKHPKYTNIIQEEEIADSFQRAENKKIHEENFSFLDQLKYRWDKSRFIEYFVKVTGFPSLKESSKRMVNELQRVFEFAARANGSEVLMSGYDSYCSVGLGTAIPGSDIDKGYAVIKDRFDSGSIYSHRSFSNEVKGSIWNNIDSRLVSVNHCAAFPNVVTDSELTLSLDKYDKIAKSFVDNNAFKYFQYLRMSEGKTIPGAKFNIWLSERINNKDDKYDAKNLAYIMETIRDGRKIKVDENYYYEDLGVKMNNSPFSWCSNVNHNYVMGNEINEGSRELKPKLKARMKMEEDFYKMSVDERYELVKDVIRGMSGDNKNPKYAALFEAKEDRHRLLLNDILRGKVQCSFVNSKGGESAYLHFVDPNTIHKYYDIDIYEG